jgi:hypothetical protein
MNIKNTMCRLSNLTQEQIDNLVYAMPESDYFDFSINEPFIGFNANKNSGTFLQEANPKIVTYTEMMQLLGKTMEFTKSDLKTGMFVKNRNGNYKIVIGDTLSGIEACTTFSNFNDGLISNLSKGYDIVVVYKALDSRFLSAYLNGESLKLIWERTEQTPVQKEMEELQAQITKLQEQAKVLQSKL